MRFVALSFIILLISCSEELPAENLSDLGFYSSPKKIIAALDGKTDGPAENFMLARALGEEKEYRRAVIHFANSCFRSHTDLSIKHFPQPVYKFATGFHLKSKFYPDAVYELARLYSLYREHKYVVKFAEMVPDDGSALYRDAMLLKAQSLSSLKQQGEALACLRGLLDDYRDPGSAAIIRIRIASLLEQDGKMIEAMTEYVQAASSDESAWQAALAAGKVLDIMKTNSADFSDEDKITLAKALYHGRRFKEALSFLDTLKSSKDSGVLLIKCLTRTNEAARISALLGKGGSSSSAVKTHADELWAMGRKAQAMNFYTALYTSGPEPEAREAMERAALYMEDRKAKGFENMLLKYVERYGNHESSASFLWLLGRHYLRQNNKGDAEKFLAAAVDRFPEGPDSGNCRFWLYKLQQERGDVAGALETAGKMAFYNPDSSYAWRLFSQLSADFSKEDLIDRFDKALSGDNDAQAMLYHTLLFIKEKDLSKRTGRIGRIGHNAAGKYRDFGRAFMLLSLGSGFAKNLKGLEKYFETGYLSGISRELQIIPETDLEKKDLCASMMFFGTKYRIHYLAIHGALDMLKLYGLKENIVLMPEEAVKGLLPQPFEKCAARSGERFGVEKNLIYAVVKAESLFNHAAVSSAGAVGLMQLMPATARGIARDLSVEKGYDLKDPCTSLLFGTQYISWLQGYLEGNFEYMVAGYNGGAGNVNRWKKDLNAPDMDYFTEFVPFDETRFYILRTGKFLAQYRSVYGVQ